MLAGAASAQVQPASYHFRQPSSGAPIALGPQVLSADEQAYLAALPEIRVAVGVPPPSPYQTVSSDGEIGGIHSEMLMYLTRAFGLKVRPVVVPNWGDALNAVRRRDADLIMTVGVTNERMSYLEFTLGVTPWPGALFARTAAAPLPLEHARFAIERDYMAIDFVRRQYPEASIQTVENTGEALAAVAAGRADYYLGALFEAMDWWSRPGVQGVEVRQMLNYGTGYYHFGVRKDWARLALILNKGISALREAPLPQWQASAPALPAKVALAPPLQLSASEQALLVGHPTWRMGAVRGLSLLNDINARGIHTGIAAEYAEQVARRLGVGLQVIPYDSVASMLDGLRRGEIDLVPFLTRTPAREKEFAFSRPYVEMPYLLVSATDGPYYWDLNSLRGHRLALAEQHPLREVLARSYPDIRIVDMPDGAAAMDAVARGEADAAVEVKLFANLRINSDSGNRLRAVAAVNALPAQFHFAASPRSEAMIPIIDRVLAEIPPTDHERMLRRWIAVDLDPPFPWRRHLPVISVAVVALLSVLALTLWWMRRLSREVDQRRASEAQLQAIGSNIPCVAFQYVIDEHGKLLSTYFSAGSQAFLGVSLEEGKTVLQNLAPYMSAEDAKAAAAAGRHAVRSGQPFSFAAAYQVPGREARWLCCQAVRTAIAGGRAHWTGYVVDVTAERNLQVRLTEEAQRRNLMLASASHELRAPAHTASLALQSLQTERTPEARSRALAVAQDAMHTLTQLLGDVLDAAQMHHGELRIKPQVFALQPWLQQLADAARQWAERKRLGFELVVEPGLPHLVMMDPLRMRQVAMNLLSNAVKYTDRGSIRLEASTRAGRTGERALVLTIVDSGRGIAPEQLEKVFTPFAGADPQGVVPEGSSGLGLSICRHLAALMQGEVSLRSELGQGTAAEFELPLRLVAAGAEEPLAKGVLVCDDDDVSRLLMSQMLAAHGFDVEEARDGHEALERLRRGGIGLLVTDLRMAGMDGSELVQAIADLQQPGVARPRIVVCSGDAQVEDVGPLAFDAFLTKPVMMSVLLDTLAAIGFGRAAASSAEVERSPK
ncbi:ATP-binding protein [Roseateles aquatilis]|nr:transporter substrate-binding domain-containing protein [Roseateles aquatilis]